MLKRLRLLSLVLIFVGARTYAAAASNDFERSINETFAKVMRDHRAFKELSSYRVPTPSKGTYSLGVTELRPAQKTALAFMLGELKRRNVDFCTARILEVGFGSPAVLAVVQKMRQAQCTELVEIVGIDQNSHDDWQEPLAKALRIKLVQSELADLDDERTFDVIFAIDVFKEKPECLWGPYEHSPTNSDKLTSLLAEGGLILVMNDFDADSVLDEDLSDTFTLSSAKVAVGTLEYRERARRFFGVRAKYGLIHIRLYARKGSAEQLP